MQQVNGHASGSGLTPPPASIGNSAQPSNPQINAITTTVSEVSRFMPVMEIAQAVGRRQVIVQAMQQLMQEGVDYGAVMKEQDGKPGKPTLLQPGADKLCNLFGLVIHYEVVTAVEDWGGTDHKGEPFFYYVIVGKAYRGDFLIGEGIGSCNSWEAKYRWRRAERTCPHCGQPAIIKGKEEYGGGWVCFSRKGGCNAKFKADDREITDQPVGRKPNPDIFDCVNTVQKMALKRCKVSTTINATSAAEFFTQDVEELDGPDIGEIKRDAVKINTGGNPVGTQAAADYVAQQKIDGLTKLGEIAEEFRKIREQLGEVHYLRLIAKYGGKPEGRFPSVKAARDCYKEMLVALKEAA